MEQRIDNEAPPGRSLFTVPPALRYPAYRSYWFGTLASVSGFQMLQFTQLWLIHQLTESPLFLGYVGLVNAVPAITLNLFGGVFADRLDNRRLIMITQTILASLIFLLATLTLLDVVEVWHILTIAFVAGAVNAFDQPARQALYPRLIDRKVMMSAVALNSAIWQGTRIFAPAVAGIVIATIGTSTPIAGTADSLVDTADTLIGTAAAFYLAGSGFLAMAIVMLGLRVPPVERRATGNAYQNMVDGLKFIAGNSIFSFLIAMTFFNSFFGMAYMMMMPVFAVDVLEVGADGQGWLMSIGGIGALITTLVLGSMGNFHGKGLILIGGATMFGLMVAAFALTSEFVGNYYLALVLMFTMGTASSTYMILIMSSLQMMVPNHMRGRVMGFYGMTWSIMPLGGMQSGAIANLIGVPFAVAIGGLAVSAFALGPAMINRNVRNLGTLLLQAERSAIPEARKVQPSVTANDD